MPIPCEAFFVVFFFGGVACGVIAAFLVALGLTTKAEEQNGKIRKGTNGR